MSSLRAKPRKEDTHISDNIVEIELEEEDGDIYRERLVIARIITFQGIYFVLFTRAAHCFKGRRHRTADIALR